MHYNPEMVKVLVVESHLHHTYFYDYYLFSKFFLAELPCAGSFVLR